ncbi:citrate synthase [Limnohabitans sp. Rim8]|uniref:citrate synthase n=1 Tax=Limnohabitans sp. Rim8 TaxID=1100718 RepID=UPI001E4C40DC|nr:citrate synthase [Limnohabitans sp. Rim8]
MLSDYATAAEAMALLQVRPQTLYAYVSRGWIRSVAQKGMKEKLYLREDLARVHNRSLARSGHGPVAASAMNWGEPIFATSITEITDRGPRYRSYLATDLVRTGVAFERVAELLWTGKLPNEAMDTQPWAAPNSELELTELMQTLAGIDTGNSLLEVFAMVVLMLGIGRSQAAIRIEPSNTQASAREILQTLVGCCGFIGPRKTFQPMLKEQSLVDGLIQSLALDGSSAIREVLRSVLILLADHELPPGTLSARVVASSGGTVHNCIAAALCATAGVDVGRMYGRVDDFLGHPQSRSVLEKRANKLHAAGQRVPGFDHPLYPKGDPRAALLLDIARPLCSGSRELRSIFGFIDDIKASSALLPRQELAVVVVCRTLGLPRQAPAALFAIGRTAGWVAHAMEQSTAATLLRPRAQFVSESKDS